MDLEDEENKFEYYVVEFLRPPEDVDKYVCVPYSWIRFRETSDKQIAGILYPKEELSEIKKRVKKKETFSYEWSLHMGRIKYGIDSYKDAKHKIRYLKRSVCKRSGATVLDKDENGPSTLRKRMREVELNSFNSDYNKESTPGTSKEKQLFGANFIKILTEVCSHLDQIHRMYDHACRESLQQCLMVKQLFMSLSEFNNTHPHTTNETSEKILTAIIEEKEGIEHENPTGTNRIINKAESENEKKEIHESDDDISNHQDSLSKQDKPNMFKFPPEYDKNDSRWTLRYQTKMEGLVELMPDSGIYVRDIELKKIIAESIDVNTLVQGLAMEIFSDSALRLCSVTGKKSYSYYKNTGCIRPGLDEHARSVLFKFVEKHARDQKWRDSLEYSYINHTMRNALSKMRYGLC